MRDNAKRATALVSLLAGKTVEEAAQTAGVSASTLHRWLNDPVFHDEYRSGRRALVEQAATALQAAAQEAAQTALTIMRDKSVSAAVRLRAAQLILDGARAWVELDDLASRVEALEAALKEKGER